MDTMNMTMSGMATTMSNEEMMATAFFADNKIFCLGAQFMGALFDSLFAGVILCQLTHWIPMAKHDTRIVQVLVAIGATAALCTTVYTWADYLLAFVYDFGKFSRFASWEMLGWYPILDGFTVVPVQLFFAERAVRINANSILVAVVSGVLIAGTFAAAIGITVSTRGQSLIMPTDAIKIVTVLWPTICTTAHVFITTSIVSGLLRTRSEGKNANRLVSRIVAVSLESQLPATIFAVVAMAAIASNPKGPIVPFIVITHPKVFMVGCLAMVNLRHSWRLHGKVPSTFQTQGSMAASRSGMTDSTSNGGLSTGPTTPKMTAVNSFTTGLGYDTEKAQGEMGQMKIKGPGEW